MKIVVRMMFAAILAVACVYAWRVPDVFAQSVSNSFPDTCAYENQACVAGAQSDYQNCVTDNCAGLRGSALTQCKNSCNSDFASERAQCSAFLSSCISGRNSECGNICQQNASCSTSGGLASSSYSDSSASCTCTCNNGTTNSGNPPTPPPTSGGGGGSGGSGGGSGSSCGYPGGPACPGAGACAGAGAPPSQLNCFCDTETGQYSCYSPILIDTTGEGFSLGSVADGVRFDLVGDGSPRQTAWPVAGSGNGWLVLDRNNNGVIDDGKELFGNYTDQPGPRDDMNGYRALAVFDTPNEGGNGDGFIEKHDAVYSKLRVWIDANHDGVSQPGELHTLPELGIKRLFLKPFLSDRHDANGNIFRLKARIRDIDTGRNARWTWDVYLQTAPLN